MKRKFLWFKEHLKLNLLSMLEYRKSFLIQTVGMVFNNIGFIVVWYLFFDIFKEINGWRFNEMLGLYGFTALNYGLLFSIGYGTIKISKKIYWGEIDKFIILPKNTLISLILSETNVSAMGDILFGILLLTGYLFFISASPLQILLSILLALTSTFVFTGFLISAQSVAFWIPNSEELSEALFELMFGPSLYPSSTFTGITRFIFTFLFPSLVIGGIPVNILLTLNPLELLLFLLIALFWLIFSIFIFNTGLKRYESGNMIGNQ